MKKNALIFSALTLLAAICANTAVADSGSFTICSKGSINTGSCYSSNSSDNQKCIPPQTGDAKDCASTVVVTIGNN